MIHDNYLGNSQGTRDSTVKPMSLRNQDDIKGNSDTAISLSNIAQKSEVILLSTALVEVIDSRGQTQTGRALYLYAKSLVV